MIFGKIIFDKRNRSLIVEKPYFYLQDKFQLIQRYKSRLRKWKLYHYASLILMIVFLALALKRLVRMSTSIKNYLRKLKNEVAMDKLKGLKNLLTNDFVCVNCKENPRTVILRPCLHMCFCKSCFKEQRITVCPICEKPIKDTVNIFVV